MAVTITVQKRVVSIAPSSRTVVVQTQPRTVTIGTVLSGETNTGANVGGGVNLFRDKTGMLLNFRTLVGTDKIDVTQIGDTVQIDASLPNFSVTGTGQTTTASAIDVLMNGMAVTPGAGVWLVMFGASVVGGGGSNIDIALSIYANGVQAVGSERLGQIDNNEQQAYTTHAIVSVAAGQVIEGRWRSDGTRLHEANDRRIDLVKLSE